MTVQIHYRLNPPVAEIVFDAPARRNAFDMAMWAALPDLIARTEADAAARAVILHGGETGHFAAGADISEFDTIYANRTVAEETATVIADGLNAIAGCQKPVIAAIEGACVGGGVSLALAADIRIASTAARFGVTPAKLGLVYPGDDTERLVRTVGLSQAKDILFTGDLFGTDRALRIGLIDDTTAPGEAFQGALQKARIIAANSQASIRAAKAMITDLESSEGLSRDEALSRFVDGVTGDDFAEGYRAFLEKRAPDFPED